MGENTISDEELADFRVIDIDEVPNDLPTAKIADAAVTSAKLDESTIQYAEVAISNAEVLLLNSAPKELVAAPGAGKVLEFLSAVLINDHGGTDFAANGNLTIQTGTTGTAQSDTVAEGDFLFASADAIRCVQALSADVQMDANESLVLACATGEPTTGDGVLRAKVAYRVHTTGL